MALSMDEQRMLAEIERRLAAEDPRLATRLSSFRRPRRATGLRTPRGRIIGSLCTLMVLAVIGFTVYATIPFRTHTAKTPLGRSSSASPSVSAPARAGALTSSTAPGAAAQHGSTTGSTAAAASHPAG